MEEIWRFSIDKFERKWIIKRFPECLRLRRTTKEERIWWILTKNERVGAVKEIRRIFKISNRIRWEIKKD
jgi:hypothetical protein